MGNVKDKVCLALDVATLQEAERLVKATRESVGYFKVGLQLFCAVGPRVVETIVEVGGKVFLDLKFHDIPNTVAGATRSIVSLGASIFNVHTSGGLAMMKATVNEAHELSRTASVKRPLVIGVTVLTSLNTENLRSELGIEQDSKAYALRLAELAKQAGLDGIVCSAEETASVRREIGSNFYIINPGIRPEWSVDSTDDQKRITTPRQAIEAGASLIVIGRPILKSGDPTAAAQRVYEEVERAADDSRN